MSCDELLDRSIKCRAKTWVCVSVCVCNFRDLCFFSSVRDGYVCFAYCVVYASRLQCVCACESIYAREKCPDSDLRRGRDHANLADIIISGHRIVNVSTRSITYMFITYNWKDLEEPSISGGWVTFFFFLIYTFDLDRINNGWINNKTLSVYCAVVNTS